MDRRIHHSIDIIRYLERAVDLLLWIVRRSCKEFCWIALGMGFWEDNLGVK